MSLLSARLSYQQRFEQFSYNYFAQLQHHDAKALYQAIHYSFFNGGKGVRPFLVYAVGSIFNTPAEQLDYPALAIECIHAYSLIHDDLPAMDNDDLRRGKPTCHIQYGEAMAILAGDALQTEAFRALSHAGYSLQAENKLAMIQQLSKASGLAGMCGGQALDILAEQQRTSVQELERIHQLKTGALIQAAVLLGYHASGIQQPDIADQLTQWAQAIGLLYQVQDDILEVTSDSDTLGKSARSDQDNHKATYPALLGLEGATAKREQLRQLALQTLTKIPYNTHLLAEFTHFLATRER